MKKNYTQLKAQLAKYIGDEVCFLYYLSLNEQL